MKQIVDLKEGMTAKVEGGKLVIEMPEKYTPKKGDFVTCDRNTHGNKWIMIWGGVSPSGVFTSEAVAYNEILGLTVSGHCCRIDDNFRPSTPEEIDILLSAMRKQGKQWDAKQMKVVDLKWEPKRGEVVKSTKRGYILIFDEQRRFGITGIGNLYYYDHEMHRSVSETICNEVQPTTREDRCAFFEALTKAGYKWDSKKMKLSQRKEKWEPKDGDFVAHTDKYGDTLISIFKEFRPDGTFETHAGVGDGPCIDLLIDYWGLPEWADRPATESEIKIMNDALAKAGKRWNSELKRVEDIEFKVGDCVIGRDTLRPANAKFVERIDVDHNYPGNSMCKYDNLSNKCSFKYLRHATDAEKAQTVSDLYEKGKVWNKKLNCIEDIKPNVVEMTMEQVCEKLGMNVKIVKK